VLPLRSALVIALLAACSRERHVPLQVKVCGYLCGDHSDGSRLSTDFSGIACAESVRVRALDAVDPSTVVAEQCLDLRNAGRQFQDLFDDLLRPADSRPAPLANLPKSGRVTFDVALYPPLGAGPCAEGSPFVAFGRSAIVDLAAPPDAVLVPLGCHEICDIQTSMRLSIFALEDDSPLGALPDGTSLVDIFPYEVLTSTAGSCTMAHVTQPHSELRQFPVTYQGNNSFAGNFSVDSGPFAGCVAVALPNRVNACVEQFSGRGFDAWIPNDAHVAALEGIASSNSAGVNGLLVVRVFDNMGNTPPDAHVFYLSGTGNPAEADYVTDSTWSTLDTSGNGVGTEGIAVFVDAPGGPYFVQVGSGDPFFFHAAGGDDPTSITTYTVYLP
jgi:hypothetical protein